MRLLLTNKDLHIWKLMIQQEQMEIDDLITIQQPLMIYQQVTSQLTNYMYPKLNNNSKLLHDQHLLNSNLLPQLIGTTNLLHLKSQNLINHKLSNHQPEIQNNFITKPSKQKQSCHKCPSKADNPNSINCNKIGEPQLFEYKENLFGQHKSLFGQSSCYHSYQPFESNRTLQPYLINIRQEYVCTNQLNPNCPQQKPNQRASDTQSIQLSESREVSQELLLHNSVSSNFLSSPTLSLALAESKITKRQAESQNNSQPLKQKPKNPQQLSISTQFILSVPNPNPKLEHKFSFNHQRQKQFLKINQQNDQNQLDQIKLTKQPQHIQNQVLPNNLAQQFNHDKKKTKVNLLLDPESHSSIITSYQMEVECLRKINLVQSLEIQKLRKLVRLTQKDPNSNPNQKNYQTLNKKAIDIISKRQIKNSNKQYMNALKQKDLNIKNTSIGRTTDLQFICGDQNDLIRNSISFSTKKQFTTADTFYSDSINSIPNTKVIKKRLSIGPKDLTNYHKTNPSQKSHNLSIKTNQLNVLQQNNHNMSCSTYFMATKNMRKSGKSKVSLSSSNLSRTVSSSNKQNKDPKRSIKKGKKELKKQHLLLNSMEMFVNTKKHAEHLSSIKKGKK